MKSLEKHTQLLDEKHTSSRDKQRQMRNTLCKEMERDVIGTKKLIYQLPIEKVNILKMKDPLQNQKRSCGQIISDLLNVDTQEMMG